MSTERSRTYIPRASIRMIWGIAKSQELSLTDEDLYALVERETGKQHMRDLSYGQIEKVCRVLQQMRDGGSFSSQKRGKRTDTGGNPRTVAQRQKIYRLTGQLGWNDNNARINRFAQRMFGVQRIEWLSSGQCDALIEALKAMLERKQKKEEENDG